MNATRQLRSLVCGLIRPSKIPLTPAMRPVNSMRRTADSPINAPPTAAETGVKLFMTFPRVQHRLLFSSASLHIAPQSGGSRRGPDLDFFMPPSPKLMDLPRRDIQSECSAQPLGDKGRAQTPIRRDVGNIRHRHRNRRPSLASPLRKRLYRSGRWYQKIG